MPSTSCWRCFPTRPPRRREIYRLHEWLLARELTGLITAKAGGDGPQLRGRQPFGFMQFMVDCAVILKHSVVLGVSQRNLRVQKYRGSSFDENESPFLIGATGLEVAVARTLGRVDANVTNERVSSGVERLDTMLGGGYYRGASVLITGFPGHGQDDPERRLRGGGLPPRRAHHVRQLRFGRRPR